MNDLQRQFLDRATAEAVKANHPFPQMAACEAALESSWGHSEIAIEDNNLFGTKQHKHPIYLTHNVPTREFEKGQWEVVDAAWIHYPDWHSCFADRLATLQRLSNALPHYKAALEAQDPRSYAIQVSDSWSTDPGWECACCSMFQSESGAQQHARENADSDEHAVRRVEGLGRALKAISIYEDYTAAAPTASSS
jgi:flagellum-specific peptidoglycan hydrolase FlgJ